MFTLSLFNLLPGMSYVQCSCFGADEIKALPSVTPYRFCERERATDDTGPTDAFTGFLSD